MSKPKVFFDITADGKSLGRITMEVSHLVAFSQPALVGKISFLNFIGMVSLRIIFAALLLFFFLQLRADVVPKTAGKK